LQSIVPALFRKVAGVNYQRERIHTPDGDFLDLDWLKSQRPNLLIICHGLEGSTDRAYVKGIARFFNLKGWDVLTWNYRGCGQEINRKLRFYHSGATDDLETVIKHASINHHYLNISLVGFSLGGNLVLKYLGERGSTVISKAVGLSVPMDLYGSCLQISNGFNRIYGSRFLRKLKQKVKTKAALYPGVFDLQLLDKVKYLIEFDDFFTAPIHGFKNALDYYQKCSSLNFINNIQVPTLVVNALNDPMLSPSCYPKIATINHRYLELLYPVAGGHCGFADTRCVEGYWSEELVWNYLNH
jgi:predicted alpha/beta-fold hydrolase